MLFHADIVIADSGDLMIITDGAGLMEDDEVVYAIRGLELSLRSGGITKLTIPLESEDLKDFDGAPSINVMDMHQDGSYTVVNDIKRLSP